jgi:ketol-acid reductoisomerase
MPVFKDLYERVASGAETKRVIETGSKPDYKQMLGRELAEIHDSEMWRAGQATRDLRPHEESKGDLGTMKGTGGRQSN